MSTFSRTVVETSLASSRTMPALILDGPRNQTPSSAVQSIPPTGGNPLRQRAVGRAGGEARLGSCFLWKPPSGSEALPWLRLPKGCSPWCVQASRMDVIVPSLYPSSDKGLSVKPICLTQCLGSEGLIRSLRVLHGGLRQDG